MKTKTTDRIFSQEELENDLAELAPRVRRAFAHVEEPSLRVLDAIHKEAVAVSAQRARRRHFIPLFRMLATAAALALLLGGAVQMHLAHLEVEQARQVGHLINLGMSHVPTGKADGTAELANRLLDLQGLNEESFFVTTEEPESLSL